MYVIKEVELSAHSKFIKVYTNFYLLLYSFFLVELKKKTPLCHILLQNRTTCVQRVRQQTPCYYTLPQGWKEVVYWISGNELETNVTLSLSLSLSILLVPLRSLYYFGIGIYWKFGCSISSNNGTSFCYKGELYSHINFYYLIIL